MCYLKIAVILSLVNEIYANKFSYDPESKKVIEGQETSLVCLITGSVTEQELSWYKDDVKISEGRKIVEKSGLNRRQILVDFTSAADFATYELQFNHIDVNDEGAYACAFYRNKEELKSNPGFLTVLQLPDSAYPLCKPIPNSVLAGETVTVQCNGETLNPPIVLKLFRNGVSMERNVDILRKDDVTSLIYLLVPNLSDNNAIFTCQLKTPADNNIVRNCSIGPLNVWYKPNVTIQHAGTTLSEREAIFICQTNANPPVKEFTWNFDPPLNIDRYDVDDIGQVMRILRVTVDDNGLIVKCTARNTVDQVTNQVIMEVIDNVKEEKPKTNAIESPNHILPEKKNISLSVLLAIVAVLVLVIVFAIIIPVYYFCVCAKKDETTLVVAQPEVYFEPQDRMTLPLSNKRHSVLWRRSFGAQVPIDRDVDAMYLEIQSDHYIFTPDSRGNTLPY